MSTVTGFAVAYLAVWAIFGAVALAFVAALPGAQARSRFSSFSRSPQRGG